MVHWIKLPSGTPAPHIDMSALSSGYSVLLAQLVANMPGKQQMEAQVLGFLPPTWGTWVEFLVASFSLLKYWLLQVFETEPVYGLNPCYI